MQRPARVTGKCPRSILRTSCVTLGVVASLAGCGGGGGDGPTEPAPTPKPVAAVTVTLAQSTLIVARTAQATASLTDANGATLSGRTVLWSSSNTAVATVDQSGLVTGVTVGTATITATSEGKSGSAALSVIADPATTATVQLGAITSNGVAVDVSKVAGPISVNIDDAVPPNFVGTLVVTLRDIEVARFTYPSAIIAPAPVGTMPAVESGSTQVRQIREMQVDVPSAIVTINANDLMSIGVKWQNGPADLKAVINGAVGATPVQASTTRSLTLANPSNSLIGVIIPQGNRATGAGGNTWDSGDLRVALGVLNYESTPALLDQIEVMTGPAPAVYGITNNTTSVFAKNFTFTPTATPTIVIPKSELALESPLGGSRLWVSVYRINGQLIDPQITVPSLNGISFDTNGDGFVDNTPAPLGITLPTGVTRGLTFGEPSLVLLSGKRLNASLPFRYDNRAPLVPTDAYMFSSRVATPYQSPLGLLPTVSPINNYVSPSVDLRGFANLSKITDAGAGVSSASLKYYVGTSNDLGTLTGSSNLWTPGTLLTPTGSRINYSAVAIEDVVGNVGRSFLTTSGSNPYTTGNVTGTAGVSPALFEVGPVMSGIGTITGITRRAHSTSSSLSASLKYTFTMTGGAGTFGVYGLTGSVTRGADCVVGTGSSATECNTVNIPAMIEGVGAMSWSMNDILGRVTGDKQGLYRISMLGYDNAGTPSTGDSDKQYSFLHDFTPPTMMTGSGVTSPFTAGQSLMFTGMAGDNVTVGQFEISANFETFVTPSFSTGYVNAPVGNTDWRNPFSNTLAPTLSASINTPLPHRIALYDFAGNKSSPDYSLTGITWRARDGNGLLSTNRIKLDIGAGLLPSTWTAPPVDVNYIMDPVPPQTVCSERVATCPPQLSRTLLLAVRARTALAINPFLFAQFYAIAAGGEIYRLCRANSVTATFAAALWAYAYACTVDWDDYKGPPGALTLFAWLYTSQYVVLKSQFYGVNLQAF